MKNSSERYTYPFFETIRILNGIPQLLNYHQQRVDHTFNYFFPQQTPLSLNEILVRIGKPAADIVKCRILYNASDYHVTLEPYSKRSITKLLFTEQKINYAFKFTDRQAWENLESLGSTEDEAVVVTGGRIRESTYGNIIFQMEGRWFTPLYPIFFGVMRQYLLDKQRIYTKDLFLDDLRSVDEVKIVNAMMPMENCITLNTFSSSILDNF